VGSTSENGGIEGNKKEKSRAVTVEEANEDEDVNVD
jgi:hypothetical protein